MLNLYLISCLIVWKPNLNITITIVAEEMPRVSWYQAEDILSLFSDSSVKILFITCKAFIISYLNSNNDAPSILFT